jgi:hypothetical protein
LLERGVTVAGSSSMGALRAAELWPFGMRGVGEVFRLYRDDIVQGDDEVAIVHAPAEEGYRALSEPLVNVRVAMAAAVRAGVLDDAAAAGLVRLGRELPFRARTYRAIARRAEGTHLAAGAAAFLAWHARHPVDAKADDARLLLRMAADGPDELRPPGPGDRAIENVDTSYLRNWQVRHRHRPVDGVPVSEAEVITTLLLLHPQSPALRRAHVLSMMVGDAVPADELECRALELARDRGLWATVAGGTLPEPSWLTARERRLPVAEVCLRLMIRAYGGVTPGLVSGSTLPGRLDASRDEAAQVVATAAGLNDRLLRVADLGATRRRRLRPHVVRQLFAGIWRCEPDQVEAEAWDRGFADAESFWEAAEPLGIYLKLFGRPEFSPI